MSTCEQQVKRFRDFLKEAKRYFYIVFGKRIRMFFFNNSSDISMETSIPTFWKIMLNRPTTDQPEGPTNQPTNRKINQQTDNSLILPMICWKLNYPPKIYLPPKTTNIGQTNVELFKGINHFLEYMFYSKKNLWLQTPQSFCWENLFSYII